MPLSIRRAPARANYDMTPKKQHGGKRAGSGRHKTKEKVVTRSVSMPPEAWASIDHQRGKLSRGKWIMARIGIAKKGGEK